MSAISKKDSLSGTADRLFKAAEQLYLNASDLGETTNDRGKEHKDWAALHAALDQYKKAKARGKDRYLLVIYNDSSVDSVKGPYKTNEQRHDVAQRHHRRKPGDGLYYIESFGKPDVFDSALED